MKDTIPAGDCSECLYWESDEETGEDYCVMPLDEDELGSLMERAGRGRRGCPYFRNADEYHTSRLQGETPYDRAK